MIWLSKIVFESISYFSLFHCYSIIILVNHVFVSCQPFRGLVYSILQTTQMNNDLCFVNKTKWQTNKTIICIKQFYCISDSYFSFIFLGIDVSYIHAILINLSTHLLLDVNRMYINSSFTLFFGVSIIHVCERIFVSANLFLKELYFQDSHNLWFGI